MIQARLYARGERLCGFKTQSHGGDIVCAAVSMLCINTVNSLEALTSAPLEYRYDEGGGYIECILPGILSNEETSSNEETPFNEVSDLPAELLLRSLALGLASVRDSYGGINLQTVNLQTEEASGDFGFTIPSDIKGNTKRFKR